MTDWGKFANFDAQKVNDDLKALGGSGSFEDLPDGKYEVRLEKMDLRKTKKDGFPMISASFKVVQGKYKNRLIFVNMVVVRGDENDWRKVRDANKFLESFQSGLTISFEGVREYEQLVEEVLHAVEASGNEYLLEQVTNGTFKNYKIVDVYQNGLL